MRSLIAVAILGVAFSSAPMVFAGANSTVKTVADKEKKAGHGLKGTVSGVDGTTVTVTTTNKKSGKTKDVKVMTDDKTKVTLDGKEAKLADLKAGQMVSVTPGEGGKDAAASQIEATSAAK